MRQPFVRSSGDVAPSDVSQQHRRSARTPPARNAFECSVLSSAPVLNDRAIGHRPRAAAIQRLAFGSGSGAEPTGPVRGTRQGDTPPRPGCDGSAGRGTCGDALRRRSARIGPEGGAVEHRGRLLGDRLALPGGGGPGARGAVAVLRRLRRREAAPGAACCSPNPRASRRHACALDAQGNRAVERLAGLACISAGARAAIRGSPAPCSTPCAILQAHGQTGEARHALVARKSRPTRLHRSIVRMARHRQAALVQNQQVHHYQRIAGVLVGADHPLSCSEHLEFRHLSVDLHSFIERERLALCIALPNFVSVSVGQGMRLEEFLAPGYLLAHIARNDRVHSDALERLANLVASLTHRIATTAATTTAPARHSRLHRRSSARATSPVQRRATRCRLYPHVHACSVAFRGVSGILRGNKFGYIRNLR